MTRTMLITCLAATIVAGCGALSSRTILDRNLGLAKGSVFDTPTPVPFTLDGTGVTGAGKVAYGAPPLVPHPTDEYVPITTSRNACLACHDRPGAKAEKGQGTPMPPLHYAKVTGGSPRLLGDYYSCELCHAPAANVPDLVGNEAPRPAR
jgi:nitrate reductase cytochrome c-type subunit